MNENRSDELSFTDALLSWFQTVYLPVINVIEEYRLLSNFKNRTKSDIYVWLIKHWDELKQKNGNDYTLDEATKDFVEHKKSAHPPALLTWLKGFFHKRMQ